MRIHGFIQHPKIARKQDGFTLLELVVSVAIVALISVVLSQVFLVTLRTNAKTEISKDMKQNGDLALESMVRMIQKAQRVTSTCAGTGTVSQSITITNEDGGQTTYECVLDGASTRLASTSAQGAEYLTSSNVTMGGSQCSFSSLSFTCAGGAGVPASVTIAFQLSQSGMSDTAFEQANESFQTTATVRNSSE